MVRVRLIYEILLTHEKATHSLSLARGSRLDTHLPVTVALVEPNVCRLAHTFVDWTRIYMGLIVEGVAQVAASSRHSCLEAA